MPKENPIPPYASLELRLPDCWCDDPELTDTALCPRHGLQDDFPTSSIEQAAEHTIADALTTITHAARYAERADIVANMRRHADEFRGQRKPYNERGDIAAQVLSDCADSIEAQRDGFGRKGEFAP